MNNRIANYHYVDGALRSVKHGRRVFLVGIAAAYNAFGLIGPEYNGLFILDETRKAVVLDRHAGELSGYHGPSAKQWAELERVCKLSWPAFRDFCDSHERSRGPLPIA